MLSCFLVLFSFIYRYSGLIAQIISKRRLIMRHRLKELRKELNLTQADMYKDICSRNSYSRYENNKQPIPFDLLIQFLNRIGIPLQQYIQFLEKYDHTNIYEKIEKQLFDLLKKTKEEQELFFKTEFKLVQKNRFKNVYALLVFIQVKSMFASYLKVKIPPLTKLDLAEIEEFYENRSYILPVDFAILANIIASFSCKELQRLENLITKNITPPSSSTYSLKKLGTAYVNFVIRAIREDDNVYAEHYLSKLKRIAYKENNYSLKLFYLYYENLANFMKTNNLSYINEANGIIQIFQRLEDYDNCASLLEEMDFLLQSKKIKISKNRLKHPVLWSE